ncbi:MAG: response regulator transcription factor [Spirochaetales bacterium]|nr:response regulator transcription factor [Spirochaetales bacterium]
MTKQLRVVIIDDHPPVREGIAAIIGRTKSHVVVGTAGTYDEGVHLVQREKPDAIVLDVTLPDGSGLDLVRKVAVELPETRIMILTVHARRQLAERAFAAGADGYLLKESSGEFLVDGLARIADGDRVLDPKLVSAKPTDGCEDSPDATGGLRLLSLRESEVFRLLAVGQSVKRIAGVLGISPKTVDNHRAAIMQKLCVGSIAELVRIAIRTGTIDP